ncbi:DNA-3-methyladenine glycosylase II [Neorhizobium sp. R1-B]|uniref:DNA-3-methyladenine glycosylase family protein n=1 Tax=Neorhizobium TaxID=1525371 RepID=UPI000CF92D1C|nr:MULTISPECIES: DNA-3-methyladenine glycosylase [Neorhizobium]TCV70975.1 DNA-3-methyladenine glycosylase II [Neorhizobium sp. S3-V5DH]TDX83382.1 DNA-3-methyladenine glycosylase II [Neorhizobium sp. R1-B]
MRIIRGPSDIQAGLEALVELDPRLVSIVGAAGPVPLRLNEPGFAGLASIIVSQMVSRASAEAIWGRITAAGPVTAAGYAALDPAVVATFGLSRAKAATLLNLSTAISQGLIDLESICELETGEAIRTMTALPGIGPWTAGVYLMFCGGHPDIFPSGDVALQAAVGHALGLEARPQAKDLAAMAEAWRPWRSVAARLFWAYYAAKMRRDATPLA